MKKRSLLLLGSIAFSLIFMSIYTHNVINSQDNKTVSKEIKQAQIDENNLECLLSDTTNFISFYSSSTSESSFYNGDSYFVAKAFTDNLENSYTLETMTPFSKEASGYTYTVKYYTHYRRFYVKSSANTRIGSYPMQLNGEALRTATEYTLKYGENLITIPTQSVKCYIYCYPENGLYISKDGSTPNRNTPISNYDGNTYQFIDFKTEIKNGAVEITGMKQWETYTSPSSFSYNGITYYVCSERPKFTFSFSDESYEENISSDYSITKPFKVEGTSPIGIKSTIIKDENNNEVSQDSFINKKGTYTITSYDNMDLQSSITVKLEDYTSPIINFLSPNYNYENEIYYTKEKFQITVSENLDSSGSTYTYTKNGGNSIPFKNGEGFEENGEYVFTCEDISENVSSIKVIKADEGQVFIETTSGSKLTAGSLTNSNIFVTTSFTNVKDSYIKTFTINGEDWKSKSLKQYFDKRNTSPLYYDNYDILYDLIKQERLALYSLYKYSEISSNGYKLYDDPNLYTDESNVYLYYSLEKNEYYVFLKQDSLNKQIDKDVKYTIGEIKSTPYSYNGTGEATIYYEDFFGTIITKTIYIDKNAPVLTSSISNNEITNQNVIISCNEDCVFYINGVKFSESYSKELTISNEDSYQIWAFDKSGNKSNTIEFVIDKTPPKVKINNIIVEDGKTYTFSEAKITWDEESCTGLINSDILYSGRVLNEEETYEISVSDALNNVIHFTIIIDKTAPSFTAYYVNNGKNVPLNNNEFTSKDVIIVWNENDCTAYLDSEEYISGTNIIKEGKHTFYIVDQYGNSSQKFYFVIDKTNPAITASTSTLDLEDNQTINESFRFEYDDKNILSAELYKNEELINPSYTSGSNITEDGKYTLIVKDSALNTSSMSITINTKGEVISIYTTDSSGITKLFQTCSDDGSNEIIYYINSSSFYLDWSNSSTIENVENYIARTVVSSEGSYSYEFETSEGNYTRFTVVIDRTPQQDTFSFYYENYNGYLSTWYQTNIAWNKTNSYYQFSTYLNAERYALKREFDSIDVVKYNLGSFYSSIYSQTITSYSASYVNDTIYVYYDEAHNSLYGYATLEEAKAVAEAFALTTITNEFYNGKKANNVHPDDSLDRYYTYEGEKYKAIYLTNNKTYSISPVNNKEYLYINFDKSNKITSSNPYSISTSGYYFITEVDQAGNEYTFVLILDNEESYFLNYKNLFTADQPSIYFSKKITLNVRDDIDDSPIIYCGKSQDDMKPYINSITLTEGKYYVYLIDAAKNKTETKIIYVSEKDVLASIIENYADDDINKEGNPISFNFKLDLQNQFNTIQNFIVQFNNGTSYTNLFVDDNGLTIEEEIKENKNFYFKKTGIYQISWNDNFGRTYQYSYQIMDKTAPKFNIIASLSTSNTVLDNSYIKESLEYDSKSAPVYYINSSFKINWNTSDISVSYSKNNGSTWANYISDTYLSSEGLYLFKFDNGDQIYYTFVKIDRTSAVGSFYQSTNSEQIANKSTISGDFYFTSADSDIDYCEFTYKDVNGNISTGRYTLGTVLSSEGEYTFKIFDLAGNVSSITYKLTIDKTAPTIKLYNGSSVYENGQSINQSFIYLSWNEENCELYKYNFTIGTYENVNISSTTTRIKVEGDNTYRYKIVDAYGNSTIVNFKLDTKFPIGNWKTFDYDPSTNSRTNETSVYEANASTNLYTSFVWDEEGISAEIIKTYSYIDENGVIHSNHQTTEIYHSNDVIGKELDTLNIINNEMIIQIIIRDESGNISIYNMTIDRLPPELIAKVGSEVINSEESTNQDVKISWSEENCKLFINGELIDTGYKKYYLLTEEDEYYIRLYDKNNNYSEFKVVIDKTPVTINLTGVEDNGFTNEDVIISCDEDCYYEYTINGVPYSSSSQELSFYEEGEYVIYCYDNNNNMSSVSFTIIKHNPVIDFTNLNNDNLSNTSVKASWQEQYTVEIYYSSEQIENPSVSDLELIATKTSSSYTCYDSGTYLIKATDLAGNVSYYSFIIDTSSLKATMTYEYNNVIYTLSDKGSTNQDVTISWNKANCDVYVNSEKVTYENNSLTIASEGLFVVTIKDKFGNTTTRTFTIDKTPIKIRVFDSDNNELDFNNPYTNKNIYFTWDEEEYTSCKVNGVAYTKGKVITKEGSIEIVIIDNNNNINTYQFYISRDLPIINLDGVENNGITNQTVKISWNDSSYIVSVNNEIALNGQLFLDENEYFITCTNIYGTTSQYYFKIDKTAPIGTLIGVENGGITNEIVSYIFDEGYVLINGDLYNSGDSISESNKYTLEHYDDAGNVTILRFEIDAEAPVGNLFGVENNGITNQDVKFTFDSSLTATLNGEEYISGTIISEENEYSIVLTNSLGNTNVYSFTIDKTPITIHCYDNKDNELSNGTTTNQNIYFEFDEVPYRVLLNNEEFDFDSLIVNENNYTLYVYDEANNLSIFFIDIDKTPLVGTLSIEANTTTNQDVTYSWNQNQNPKATVLLNGEEYTSGTPIHNEGKNELLTNDGFNNTQVIVFYQDFTAPIGTLIGVENGGYTSSKVSFTWDEENCTAYIDGKNYTKDSIISSDGKHYIELIDAFGNKSIYEFEISHELPVGELIGVENKGFTNSDVKFTWDDDSYIVTLNGEAYNKESLITQEGEYEIKIISKFGTESTYKFVILKELGSFTLEGITENGGKTNSKVVLTFESKYMRATLNGKEYTSGTDIISSKKFTLRIYDLAGNEKIIEFEIRREFNANDISISNNENEILKNLNGVIYESVVVSFGENCTATLNGEEYLSGTIISEENEYELIITDDFGNQKSFNFTLAKQSTKTSFVYSNIATLVFFSILGVLGLVLSIKIVKSRNSNPFSISKK